MEPIIHTSRLAASAVLFFTALAAVTRVGAAHGEMGTGVPTSFGIYSQASGTQTSVWVLSDSVYPLPTGCTSLVLTPATMGVDAYKLAIATMLVAKTTNRRVRFFAHASRDNGCGVDYVEIQ